MDDLVEPQPIGEMVLMESPYAAKTKRQRVRNDEYARRCLFDCVKRGEVPMAGHMLYTQILDDNDPGERDVGIRMHLAWISRVERVVVYIDWGVTGGMRAGIEAAEEAGKPVEMRSIGQ